MHPEQAESFYRIIQEVTDVAIFTIDIQGRITSWNLGATAIFGYQPEEILGRLGSIIFVEGDKDQAEVEMAAARKDGRASDERWHVRKDGGLIWASGVLHAIHDRYGNLTSFVKLVRDLTDRKLAEQQRDEYLKEIHEASQAKDRFLATLSHELRTPLAAILGWSSLLTNKQLQEHQVQNALDVIYRNANIQKSLIDDLLDMSRITAGQLHLDISNLHLPRTIGLALDAVKMMAAAKNIAIESSIDEGITLIRGDARRIQQILWNLLCNSIKFTPNGGKVALVVNHTGSAVQIEVRDSGHGMAPEFISHAFDTFRQEDQSSTRHYGGMGLGLSIVKQLVELHGGKVSAFSEGIGKGSTFRVTLPAPTVSDINADRETQEEVPNNLLTGKRVLILENDLDCLGFLQQAIEDQGGVVAVTSSTPEALARLNSFSAEIVLVDIALPGEDGYAFIRKLRSCAKSAVRNIPAIAVTALVSDEFRERALSEGFQLFIAKPASAAAIATAVAHQLSSYQRGS